MEHDIQRAQSLADKAERVLVITGAGISAESGVPTFRTAGGLWNNIDPAKVATPEAFAADPAFVWRWYDERRVQLKEVQPNPAHHALARLEAAKGDQFFLLTQNVDDLHERAGSRRLAHIHGKIWEVRCTREKTVREDFRAPLPEIPPRCPHCGALERPNVVWFGEMIDQDAAQATELFLSRCEVNLILVIGTESSFGYILDWAMRTRGKPDSLIEINPGDTALSPYVDLHLKGKAGEILPRIVPER
ncbi:MAG TPA: NAD-dependent deacylase [bacterium]|nr:NAD-dependent deacylase [Candidatus Omnitrophota bacterium]HOJ61221.1 NAD-dependent deacylase [bacterium]HOL93434.1 NAD-dependent deacylase [bacterium]HPP01133.1 NAD-dependent deacylase [bacterium]HXK93899.1 NAD-dependent deacylase [bacterium]